MLKTLSLYLSISLKMETGANTLLKSVRDFGTICRFISSENNYCLSNAFSSIPKHVWKMGREKKNSFR